MDARSINMVMMKIIVLFAVMSTLQALSTTKGEASNSTLDNCKGCTLDGLSVFYKHTYFAASPPRFSCMRWPPVSNLSYIVGRWCSPDECDEIDFNPVKRIFQIGELDCSTRTDSDFDDFPTLRIKANSTIHFNSYNNNNSIITHGVFVLLHALLGLTFLFTCARYMEKHVRYMKVLKKGEKRESCAYFPSVELEGYDTVN